MTTAIKEHAHMKPIWGDITNYDKMLKMLNIGKPDPFPISKEPPTDRADWNQWVPPGWTPTTAHIEAFLKTFTDPDGVIRFDMMPEDPDPKGEAIVHPGFRHRVYSAWG